MVSHRWFYESRPDDGTQLSAIRKFLQEHKSVRYVWFEYDSARVSNRPHAHAARGALLL